MCLRALLSRKRLELVLNVIKCLTGFVQSGSPPTLPGF